MSQAQLAEAVQRLGITTMNQAAISRIEKQGRPIRLAEAQAIADVFGRSIEGMTRTDEVEETMAYIERAVSSGMQVLESFADNVYRFVYAQEYAASFIRGLVRLSSEREVDSVTADRILRLRAKVSDFAQLELGAELDRAIESARETLAENVDGG